MVPRGASMHKRSMRSCLAIALLSVASAAIAQTPPPAGGAQGRGAGGGRGPAVPPLIMTTTAWEDGGVIPNKYTMAAEGGAAVSPKFEWSQVPPGTQSFVLLMH